LSHARAPSRTERGERLGDRDFWRRVRNETGGRLRALDGMRGNEILRCGRKIRTRRKKLRGCIAAPPKVPFQFPKEAYLFFLAFFFAAILFSSLPEFSRQRCWRSAYTIIMYRFTELSCQEESDWWRRKSEARENCRDDRVRGRKGRPRGAEGGERRRQARLARVGRRIPGSLARSQGNMRCRVADQDGGLQGAIEEQGLTRVLPIASNAKGMSAPQG